MKTSENGDLERMMEELMRVAERLFEQAQGTQLSQAETVQEARPVDELISGKDAATYILEVPGHETGKINATVAGDRLALKGPGISIVKTLPWKADPSTAVTTCRNGVLSVRLRRAQGGGARA